MLGRETWDESGEDDAREDGWLDDREGPQTYDLDDRTDADDYGLVACPRCGREVSELAERCPYCGDWITADARGSRMRKPLLIAIAILLLVLLLLWVF